MCQLPLHCGPFDVCLRTQLQCATDSPSTIITSSPSLGPIVQDPQSDLELATKIVLGAAVAVVVLLIVFALLLCSARCFKKQSRPSAASLTQPLNASLLHASQPHPIVTSHMYCCFLRLIALFIDSFFCLCFLLYLLVMLLQALWTFK